MLDDERKQMNPPANLRNPRKFEKPSKALEKDLTRAPKMTEMTLKKNPCPRHTHKKHILQKNGPKRSFVASAVARPIYIRLYEATAAN